ncbi:Proteasome activator complex subunit 1 [Cricetulus griseus]|uniref:Proteasome activator complex subunit 1 n=1 Tax=Cricetulus griseus TaxID=10029 RepID=G3HAU2_CRIGR|nr:Proteasome activator complex subunit 1 [Cricetulus griseus]
MELVKKLYGMIPRRHLYPSRFFAAMVLVIWLLQDQKKVSGRRNLGMTALRIPVAARYSADGSWYRAKILVKEKEKEEQKKQQEKEEKDEKKKGEDEDKDPPCGPGNCNGKIVALLQRLKPEIKDVIEQLNLIM